MAIVPPSFNDFLAVGTAEGAFRRAGLTFREGNVTTADAHVAAAMADLVTRFIVQCLALTFLDQCEGDDLANLVNDHMNLQRIEATAAQVMMKFTRTSGGAGGTIP